MALRGRLLGVITAAIVLGAAACGKKGPPLPPLNLVPDRPADLTGRLIGDTTVLRFTVPTRNASQQGPLALDRLEVYAVTVAAGAIPPANRDLLTPAHLVGRIAIKPPPDPDAAADENAEKDTRPGPGEKVSFVEKLTPAQTKPEILPEPAKAAPAGAPPPTSAPTATAPSPPSAGQPSTAAAPPATPPTAGAPPAGTETTPPVEPPTPPIIAGGQGAAAAGSGGSAMAPATPLPNQPPGIAAPGAAVPAPPPAPKPEPLPVRVYMMVGVTRKGRPGPASSRVAIPLVPPPPPATALAAEFTEAAVTVKWTAPQQTGAEKRTIRYNVYAAPAATDKTPLNPQPIDGVSFEHAGAAPGVEQCFVVRSVETVSNVPLEGAASDSVCVTPRDIFPPSAPKGLAAVSGSGVINLIWDQNGEGDLAGYMVLRGEAPGDTLQPITAEPVRDARYADATVKPGVRYVYAVVAVDRANNRSTPSNRVEETAR